MRMPSAELKPIIFVGSRYGGIFHLRVVQPEIECSNRISVTHDANTFSAKTSQHFIIRGLHPFSQIIQRLQCMRFIESLSLRKYRQEVIEQYAFPCRARVS